MTWINIGLTIIGVTVANLILFRYLMSAFVKQLGGDINNIFAQPAVKKAMGIIGKRSGEVRHDEALREKVANRLVGQSPAIQYVLDFLGIDAIDGLKLLNDPLIAPLIAPYLEKGLSGLKGEETGENIKKIFNKDLQLG